MRLVIAGTRGLPANYGGFETYAEQISGQLAERGVDVYVMTPSYRKNVDYSHPHVKRLFSFDPEHLFVNKYFRAISTIFYDLLSLFVCCLHKPDVILMCGYGAAPFFFIPRCFGIKLIVNPDGFEWNSGRWGIFARSWLRSCEFFTALFANQIIADDRPVADRFSRLFNVSPTVIDYGADVVVSSRRPKLTAAGDNYFLCVARIVPETRIGLIAASFEKSRRQDRLMIIGPVKDYQYFEREVKPRLCSRIIYVGPLYDKDELTALRYHAKALIHGHCSEGTNPSLVESLGCGSVLISIDTRSNREVAGGEGFFFSTEQELTEVLDSFEELTQPRYGIIGTRNRDRARQRYSWGAKADDHCKLFRRMGVL